MDQTCETCRFWSRPHAECRRHAPVVNPQGKRYPTAMEYDWCGDWFYGPVHDYRRLRKTIRLTPHEGEE